MSTIALTLAPPRSRATARLAFQIACAVAGSALIGALAHLHIKLPFTPVPITGQTLGVLLVGAAYGPGLGAATLALYLAEGVVGLPVFTPIAGSPTGLAALGFASFTGGYLWGFIAAAALVGWLSRHGWDRSVRSSISAMLLGSIVLYVIAVPWLMAALNLSLDKGIAAGLAPFVIGDTLKLLIAAGLLPVSWEILDRFRPSREA